MTATNTLPPIPQADPRAAYLAQREAIDAAIRRVLEGGRYILGPEAAAFEVEFARFEETAHAVGCASGTAALELALRALDVCPGDGVVTVSHTAVATVAAIEAIGAVPILVDIDPHYTIDPEGLEAALARPPVPVKAVVAVHLYGGPADMREVTALASRHGARLVEDCAQSHGARLDGKRLGSFGDIAAYSLYPTKNLGAIGDGGVLTTGEAALAARLRALREYGWGERRYVSEIPGGNSRLDELQAAILRVKLERLEAGNARRRAIAARYDAALAGLPVERPRTRPGAEPVYHQYVIATDARDDLRTALGERGIGTNVHYPVPVHEQPAYAGRIAIGPKGLARTEHAARRVLSLPMFPELDDASVERVAAALGDALRSG